MSINDFSSDVCNDVHILTDLSKHYEYDTNLKMDIISNPSLLDSSFPNLIPHSFNLHDIYSNFPNNSSDSLFSEDPDFLDFSPSIQHHSRLNPFFLRSISSNSALNIVTPILSSANTLAHDIISTAPHFPPSNAIHSVCRSQDIVANDVNFYEKLLKNGMIDIGQESQSHIDSNSVELEQNLTKYWSDLECRWQILAKNDMESHPWLVHQAEADLEKAYQFSLTNPKLDCDLMEKGISLLSQGKLSSAICHFESELQFRPENSRAWLYLGKNFYFVYLAVLFYFLLSEFLFSTK